MRTYLSPSRISLFKDCSRCFFDEVFLKQKRVRGAYPTLPSGIDNIMKLWCDEHREGLPPQLTGKVGNFKLFHDQGAIDRFRTWEGQLSATVSRTIEYDGQEKVQDYFISGQIDDLFYDEDVDVYSILDYKTRREEPPPGYSEKYYQTSMDTYAFMMDELGLQTNGEAYLWYLWPEKVIEGEGVGMQFGSGIQVIQTNTDKINKMIDEIAAITPKDNILTKNIEAKRPNYNPNCEYCNYKRK